MKSLLIGRRCIEQMCERVAPQFVVVPARAGKMIGAKSLIGPPNVTLPLNAKGWHKISVGYWNPSCP